MNLPPNFLDVIQGEPDWFAARCGIVSSSKIASAIARLKRKSKNGEPGEPSAARINLRLEIIGEILTGKNAEHYVSKWMEAGRENEPLARAAYEMATESDVTQVGFVMHPSQDRCGASPDGLIVDQRGLVEFKCPKIETHLEYIIGGVIPQEYLPQMHWQMACCGPEWAWNDFVSYSPDLPKDLQLYIAPRLMRDETIISEMEAEVKTFWSEVDEMLATIRERTSGKDLTEFQLRKSIAMSRQKQELADEVVL